MYATSYAILLEIQYWIINSRQPIKFRILYGVPGFIFGPRRDEVTGEWRRLHNQELNDLYSSPNNVRVI